MQLKDLEYFVQVAKLANLTQAAQYFSVSQPTITYAIKRLEDSLGTQLLARDPQHRSVRLTETGTQFLYHARRILSEMQRARLEINNRQKEKLVLGLPPIIGNYFFPRYIGNLKREKLISRLETHSLGSEEMLTNLLNGNLNLAFIATAAPLKNPDLDLLCLDEKAFRIICGQNELDFSGSVTFKQAAIKPFIAFDEGFIHNKVFDYLETRSGVTPNVIYKTTDVDILKNMVSHNAGLALLTELAITEQDDVKVLAINEKQVPTFQIYLAYRHDHVLSAVEKAFIAIIRDQSGTKRD